MLSRRLIILTLLAFVGLGALVVSHKWRNHPKPEIPPQVYVPLPTPKFSDVKVAAQELAVLGIELYDRQAIDPELVADDAEVTIRRIVFTSPTQITEGCLKLLSDLPELKDVSCYDTDVNDEDLALLGELANIEILNLNYTQVSDAGLRHLRVPFKLAELDLNGIAITNAGLAYIAEHVGHLSRLTLYDTEVSDEGLMSLEQCRGLILLDVQKTQVTQAGVATLRDKLPKCMILADPY